MMGVKWISWKTVTTVIIALQIPGLVSVKTEAVTGVEGQTFDFRCDYRDGQQSNAKYFCHDDDNASSDHLIWTDKHNQWVTAGRFSLYDNTTRAFFIVRVDKLNSEDSGTYWCGVDISLCADCINAIQLNVSCAENLTLMTVSPIFNDLTVNKLHLALYLTALMCVTAMLSVCLFTLCLLLAFKHRRLGQRQNRETSSDYETMMPAVRVEPELRCSCSAADLSDSPPLPPPTDLCSSFSLKNRDSAVTFSPDEYVDVDVPEHSCHYQQLDVRHLEEHLYHIIHRNSEDGPLGVKGQIKC